MYAQLNQLILRSANLLLVAVERARKVRQGEARAGRLIDSHQIDFGIDCVLPRARSWQISLIINQGTDDDVLKDL